MEKDKQNKTIRFEEPLIEGFINIPKDIKSTLNKNYKNDLISYKNVEKVYEKFQEIGIKISELIKEFEVFLKKQKDDLNIIKSCEDNFSYKQNNK